MLILKWGREEIKIRLNYSSAILNIILILYIHLPRTREIAVQVVLAVNGKSVNYARWREDLGVATQVFSIW